MSKALNIHNTKKWKIRRKNHSGDKCNNAQCGICVPHKKFSKRMRKFWNKKQKLEEIKLKDENS